MKIGKVVLSLALFAACSSTVSALSGTSFWEVRKLTDIEKGDAKNVTISDNGIVRVAPEFKELFNTEQPFIFSSIVDVSGQIYLGTGHEGRIYKVDHSGSGSLFFDSPEIDVTALALDRSGQLYAATSPDGKIYKVTPDGKATVFFDPEDKYIWSLAFDDKGYLYAGTGERGVLYRIDSTGRGSVYAKVNDKHIICLANDHNGLIAGTEPGGMILRISPKGEGQSSLFALLDSPMREIHSLAVAPDGNIYALALSAQVSNDKPTSSSSTTTPSDTGGETVTVVFDEDTVVSSTPSPPAVSSVTSAKSAIYQLTPDGGSEVIWNAKDSIAFSMLLARDGSIIVGTGTKGRIYSIDPKERRAALLVQSSEEQTSTLLEYGSKIYAGANNSGKLFSIGPNRVAEGFYTSAVFDSKIPSSWGMVSWEGKGTIEVMTRSGNTENPDNTWSEWTPVLKTATGYQVASPVSRFIQWRARVVANASLFAVKLAYAQRNIAPVVSKVVVLQPSVALQELPQQPFDPGITAAGLDPAQFGFPTNLQPRKVFQRGARSLQWTSEDANGDTLTYELYYSETMEGPWNLIAKNLRLSYYTLDSDSLPDGRYYFKVLASDHPSNPPSRALTGFQLTDEVIIDNTPPRVTSSTPVIKGHSAEIVFKAEDRLSLMKRAEYSLNGGDWQTVFPEDGISDSTVETYRITVELPATAGPHAIAFRCYDESTNSAGIKVAVKQ